MKRCSQCFLYAAVFLLTCLVAGSGVAVGQSTADVAIVVHPDVPLADLSLAELRKIFMGDRQYWTTDLRITLLVRAPVARERDVVLKTIYQMTEAQFRQHWIGKVFRADVPSGPKIVYSNEMAIDQVSRTPGAIAFIETPVVSRAVKVLKVDDRLPGQAGWRIIKGMRKAAG